MSELMVLGNMEKGMSYSSIPADGSKEDKTLLYKATNKPDFKIGDYLDQAPIMAKDLYIEMVAEVDEVTGEVIGEYPNMIIITEDGKTYQSSSRGIFASLKRIVNIFGMPTWTDPIPMVFREEKSNKVAGGKYHTIDIA